MARIALLVSLGASAVVVVWAPRPGNFSLGVGVASFASMWTALAFTTSVRTHLFRAGAALVPGYRRRVYFTSLGMALAIASLPSVAALGAGISWLTVVALSAVGFAVIWCASPLLPDNQRATLSLASVGLAVDIVVYAKHTDDQAQYWIGIMDPMWQKIGLIGGGVLAMVCFSRWTLSLTEDSRLLQRWWTRDQRKSGECGGGSGLPAIVLAVMPGFTRRRLPARDNGRTDEGRLRRELYRYSLNVLSPAGLALLYLPFVMVLTTVSIGGDDPTNLFWNPNLFLLNGLIVLFGGFTPSRMRRELLKPASRPELIESLVVALRTDAIRFTGFFLTMNLVLHAVMVRYAMTTMVFWLGYAIAPALMCFGFGVAVYASRWTQWSGMVGFFPAWIVAALTYAMNEDGGSTADVAVSLAIGLGVALVGVFLARRGLHYWERAELG